MCYLKDNLVPGVISEIIIRHSLSVCDNGVQRLETQIYLGQEGNRQKFKSGRGGECFESMEEEGRNQEGSNHRGRKGHYNVEVRKRGANRWGEKWQKSSRGAELQGKRGALRRR